MHIIVEEVKMKFGLAYAVFCLLPFRVHLQEEDTDLPFFKAVTSNGYPVEKHKVETSDGYILTLFRIPHGINTDITNIHPVLLNHGTFGSSENFILLGPKKSLGYILADNGFDVWLMNSRGTWHSKQHRILKPNQKEFWQFSWHEIGVYDIPAVIDYILKITNRTALQYIGHSQGTTSAFVMGSERPEYNNKIKLMTALAPAAFYGHIKHPLIKMLAFNIKILENLADSLQIYELPPSFMPAAELREILKLLCVESRMLKKTCASLFMLISEASVDLFDKNSVPQILTLVPSSCSVKQLFHYAQLITSGNFQQYDWGPEKNIVKYGTAYPPKYNINNITYPSAFFFSSGDTLVSEQDVRNLAKKLPNLPSLYKVPVKSFNHVDFLFAKNIDKVLYKPVLKIMKEYQKK